MTRTTSGFIQALCCAAILASVTGPARGDVLASDNGKTWHAPAIGLLYLNTATSLLNGLLAMGNKGTNVSGRIGAGSGALSLVLTAGVVASGDLGNEEEWLQAVAVTGAMSLWLGVMSLRNADWRDRKQPETARLEVYPTLVRRGSDEHAPGVGVLIRC